MPQNQTGGAAMCCLLWILGRQGTGYEQLGSYIIKLVPIFIKWIF